MSNLHIEAHVGALLSGFVDGELTQQESQRVQLHIEQCQTCADELSEIQSLRSKIGASKLSGVKADRWRETMNDVTVKASRGIGWLLFIGGLMIAAGVAIFEFVLIAGALPLSVKLIVVGIYGGLFLIFLSVLRQRLIERKTDRYKDVEI